MYQINFNDYFVYIGNKILDNLYRYLSENNYKKVAVITDENVKSLHIEKLHAILNELNIDNKTFTIPPGKEVKNYTTVMKLQSNLLLNKFTNNDLIIAFGGGTVIDIAGFVAATYMFGTDYINIPTTIIGQMDASMGSKVNINLLESKNIIGQYYAPKMVISDTEFLETLDKREFLNGISEIIKYAVIRDKSLFDKLENIRSQNELLRNITEIIYTVSNIKKDFVLKDFYETNIRKNLNFASDLCNGILSDSNYHLSYGEALSISMLSSALLGEKLEITEHGTSSRLYNLLNKYKLPTDIKIIDKENLISIIYNSVKKQNNIMKFILLDRIGVTKSEVLSCDLIPDMVELIKKKESIVLKSGISLNGVINATPSKDISQIAIIASSLTGRTSVLENINYSDDILITMDILKNLNIAEFTTSSNTLSVKSKIMNLLTDTEDIVLDIKDSYKSLKYLIPLFMLRRNKTILKCSNNLIYSSIKPYLENITENNDEIIIDKSKKEFIINGPIKDSNLYYFSGDTPPEFILGLLLVLPFRNKKTTIQFTSSPEFKSNIIVGLNILTSFGIDVSFTDSTTIVINIGNYKKSILEIDSDWFSSAFFLCAGVLNGNVKLQGLSITSMQGEKAILNILSNLGSNLIVNENSIETKQSKLNNSIIIDSKNIVDLVPLIAVLALKVKGKTIIINARNLRKDGDDKLKALINELKN